ncbi:MAG: hypothetical protein LBP72_05210 [Dysgonamonadaceae bacterium]|jgi:hypothetical protein|nr:hypothetical protein [Dysgonamonadaceae bacterium]
MKRFAAHYLVMPPNRLYKLYGIELDDNRKFETIYPLKQETAVTVFLNGVLLAVNENTSPELPATVEKRLKQYPATTLFELLDYLSLEKITAGTPVNLYHLNGFDLSAAKFRADNGRSNGYIQRIC